jgi:hypothetical protein
MTRTHSRRLALVIGILLAILALAGSLRHADRKSA